MFEIPLFIIPFRATLHICRVSKLSITSQTFDDSICSINF